MKTLVMQTAHFKLPDDFEGTISDALRALADYHDDVTGKPQQDFQILEDNIAEMSFRKANSELFDRFLDCIKDGRRFVGTVQIVSYHPGFNVE